ASVSIVACPRSLFTCPTLGPARVPKPDASRAGAVPDLLIRSKRMSDQSGQQNAAAPNNSAGEDRQFVHFSFYKLGREFRLLPEQARQAPCDELAEPNDTPSAAFPL